MKEAVETHCMFTVVGVEQIDAKCWEHDENGNFLHATNEHVENIRLAAVYNSNNKDHAAFTQTTPTGELKFMCTNPRVAGTFKPGKKYLVKLVPID